jgi:putative transposase
VIQNEEDFERHFDYIHYNPVKHGLVERVIDWPWSSFHRWVRARVYPPDWGGDRIAAMNVEMEHSTGEP